MGLKEGSGFPTILAKRRRSPARVRGHMGGITAQSRETAWTILQFAYNPDTFGMWAWVVIGVGSMPVCSTPG